MYKGLAKEFIIPHQRNKDIIEQECFMLIRTGRYIIGGDKVYNYGAPGFFMGTPNLLWYNGRRLLRRAV